MSNIVTSCGVSGEAGAQDIDRVPFFSSMVTVSLAHFIKNLVATVSHLDLMLIKGA